MRAASSRSRIDGDVDHLHVRRPSRRARLRACASVASVVGHTAGQDVKPKPSSDDLAAIVAPASARAPSEPLQRELAAPLCGGSNTPAFSGGAALRSPQRNAARPPRAAQGSSDAARVAAHVGNACQSAIGARLARRVAKLSSTYFS